MTHKLDRRISRLEAKGGAAVLVWLAATEVEADAIRMGSAARPTVVVTTAASQGKPICCGEVGKLLAYVGLHGRAIYERTM